MNEVIAYEEGRWKLLRRIKENLKDHRENNQDGRFISAIKKENDLYGYFLGEYRKDNSDVADQRSLHNASMWSTSTRKQSP